MVGFLELPPEIRNTIYELAVDATQVIYLRPGVLESNQPGLAKVNKRIRSEFFPVWRRIKLDTATTVSAEVVDYRFGRVLDFLRALPADHPPFTLQIHLSFPYNRVTNAEHRRLGLKIWLGWVNSLNADFITEYTSSMFLGGRDYPRNLIDDTLHVGGASKDVLQWKEAKVIACAVMPVGSRGF